MCLDWSRVSAENSGNVYMKIFSTGTLLPVESVKKGVLYDERLL